MTWRNPCDSSACVEVNHVGQRWFVRHSDDPEVVLVFGEDEWDRFREAMKAGDFDE